MCVCKWSLKEVIDEILASGIGELGRGKREGTAAIFAGRRRVHTQGQGTM